MIDTNQDRLTINKIICQRNETIFLEEDMIVPDSKPDILSVIHTSGNVCTYKKEITDEKLRIDGSVNTCIMYVPDNTGDNVRGLQVNLDFSENLNAPNCNSDMLLETKIEIKKINCNVINGRKINVKAEIEVTFSVYANDEVEMISNIINNNDIQVIKDNIHVNSLVGSGSTRAYAKETMMIDDTDNLAEILNVNVKLLDKDIKTSYNKVLAKTEAEIKIMYLTEDNRISIVVNKIPIVGFIDIQNVSEDNICDTKFEIKNMIIKPNNAEEHSIYVELEVGISCMAYEVKEINLIQDLYSPIEELKCNKKRITTISNKQNRAEVCQIKDTVNIAELGDNGLIDANCTPKILKINKSNLKIEYEGELQIDLVFYNINNLVDSVTHFIPFKYIAENIDNAEIINVETNLEIGEQNFVVKSAGDVVIEIDAILDINMYQNRTLEIIDDIELSEIRNSEDYSLIIYIVKPGDTLWNIAKKLNSTVDDIVKANGIEDRNVINVGQKLYIPKYIKRDVTQQIESPVIANYA